MTFLFLSKFINFHYLETSPTHGDSTTMPLLISTHRPYAILAIVVLVVFVLLPVLLLMLYPFRWFQKILNVLPVRWHVLHTFMDSFQGCYKDGTEPGTRDCRWFASFFFIVRCILFLLASLASYFPIGCIALTLLALSVYLVNPFKARVGHYTDINTKYVILLTMLYLSLMGTQFTSISIFVSVFLFVSQFLAFLPLLYVFIITLQWMVRHRRFGFEVFRRWHVGRQGYHRLQ